MNLLILASHDNGGYGPAPRWHYAQQTIPHYDLLLPHLWLWSVCAYAEEMTHWFTDAGIPLAEVRWTTEATRG